MSPQRQLLQDSNCKDFSSTRPSSRSTSTRGALVSDNADRNRDRRHQHHLSNFPQASDIPDYLLLDPHPSPISNPLYEKDFFDKNKKRLVMSHWQSLFHLFNCRDLLAYDPNRPMPNLLFNLWGAPGLSALVNLLQYPPPPSVRDRLGCHPSEWLIAQAWFLNKDLNSSGRHPVFKYQFMTMESLDTVPESFLVMCARDIPPWIMRKMDNWRPYCEAGGHNQLNHYLLGWCWFWLQMEVTQRTDRIRAFVVQEEYGRIRGKEDRCYERERVRREMDEGSDPENPFKRFGIKKDDALKEAREFVERVSGIGALWFPDSEGKGKLEKSFGDAIPSKRKLSGEGNTKEYCIACNLAVVAGSGEEVLVALAANMLARAPCKLQDGTEDAGGWPKLWPLVDAWIQNLGEEKHFAVQAKVTKLAQTLFVIRKYLRWKKTPYGRDKWLYSDIGSDPYHPRDIKLTPSPTLRMMKDERAVKREWECYLEQRDPHDEEEKEKETERKALPPIVRNAGGRYLEPVPEESRSSISSSSRHSPSSSAASHRSSSSSSTRHPSTSSSSASHQKKERESYSTKHAAPLSFYNLTNSQVSPAPTPSQAGRDDSTHRKSSDKTDAIPVTVPGTSTALVRTRDYPSEDWSFESDADNETLEIDLFDDATTITWNSFSSRTSAVTRPSTNAHMGRRRTNLSNINETEEDEIDVRSMATWSHLSAVPEALNLGGKKSKREEAEAQRDMEQKKHEEKMKQVVDREWYRHEGDSRHGGDRHGGRHRDKHCGDDKHRGGSSSSLSRHPSSASTSSR